MIKLQDWHLQAIKKQVDEMLRVRCINVMTTLTLGKDSYDRTKLVLTSTPFNTVPVIHSEITIVSWRGRVYEDTTTMKDTGEKIPCTKFDLVVSASYKGNSETLFTISGEIQDRYADTIFFDNAGSMSIWDFKE